MRHRHQHDDRVHLDAADAVLDGVGVVAHIQVRHRQAVVEERQMSNLPGLEDPRDVPVVLGRSGVGARLRVPPGRRQGGAVLGLQEPHQRHLSHGLSDGPRPGPSRRPGRSSGRRSLLAAPATPIPPIVAAPR